MRHIIIVARSQRVVTHIGNAFHRRHHNNLVCSTGSSCATSRNIMNHFVRMNHTLSDFICKSAYVNPTMRVDGKKEVYGNFFMKLAVAYTFYILARLGVMKGACIIYSHVVYKSDLHFS